MLNPEQQTKLRQFIAEMNERGKNIPATIAEIDNIPIQDFQSLLEEFRSGQARLLRFSYEMIPAILSMVRRPPTFE